MTDMATAVYDANLGQVIQPTLLQMASGGTIDKRSKLVKLRDCYDLNLKKLKKEPLRKAFRDAQAAGMEKTITQCPNKALQVEAISSFYIEQFEQNDIEMSKAPIFNAKKAPNDRSRKHGRSNGTTSTTSTGTTTATATASGKRRHQTTKDPYAIMSEFSWEFRQKHSLCLVGRGRGIQIRCDACDKTFKRDGCQAFTIQQHCGEGSKSVEGATKALSHKAAILNIPQRQREQAMAVQMFVKHVPEQKFLHANKGVMVYRFEKCQAYLKAGTAFSHFDYHCVVDRRYQTFGAVGRSVMRQVIPACIQAEVERIISELGPNARICIIFDGTTRIGDVQAIIFRFVIDDGTNPPYVVHRLVALPNLESSASAAELAGELLTAMVSMRVTGKDQLVCLGRDGCSTNGACASFLEDTFKYEHFIDNLCHCHNAHNTGVALFTPPAQEDAEGKSVKRVTWPHLKTWQKIYVPTNKSHKAGVFFNELCGESDPKGMGTVRWNAKFENLFQKHRLGWPMMRDWAGRLVEKNLCARS